MLVSVNKGVGVLCTKTARNTSWAEVAPKMKITYPGAGKIATGNRGISSRIVESCGEGKKIIERLGFTCEYFEEKYHMRLGFGWYMMIPKWVGVFVGGVTEEDVKMHFFQSCCCDDGTNDLQRYHG